MTKKSIILLVIGIIVVLIGVYFFLYNFTTGWIPEVAIVEEWSPNIPMLLGLGGLFLGGVFLFNSAKNS